MRENTSVGSHLCFGHLSCKKMRSPDYFALVAPVRKTFGRASRKNYGRWSVLFRSRQSLKRFRQWSHVLLFGPVKTKLRSADTCASSAPVKRRFGRARRRKTSVGVHFCIGRASRKNFWSRHARKHFGRQPFVLRSPQLQKNAVPGLFWFGRASQKNVRSTRRKNCSRWSFLLRSRQSLQRFRQRSHVLLLYQSKQNFGRLTLVLRPRQSQKLLVAPGTKKNRSVVTSTSHQARKHFGRRILVFRSRQSKNCSVCVHFCIIRASCKNVPSRKSQKNFCRRTFSCIGRANRKNFWSHHARKHFGRQPFVLRHLSWKKLRLADKYTSTAPVAKTFSRARLKKKSVDGHMYFARPSPKNLSRRGLSRRSCQSQKFSDAPVAKTLRSAFICAAVTSVAKKIAVSCQLYYDRANRK